MTHELPRRAPGRRAAFVVLSSALILSSLALPSLVVPAAASQTTGAEGQRETDAIRVTGERLDHSPSPGWTWDLFLWRKGRRAYTLSWPTKGPESGGWWSDEGFSAGKRSIVVAYDLDGGGEVGRTVLNRIWTGQGSGESSQGANKARHMAVDEEGGRLFIPHRYENAGGSLSPVDAAEDGGGRCLQPSHDCVAGLIVLDAASLEEVGRIRLDELTVDGALLLAPQLVTISFSLGSGQGDSGKVLLLVREAQTFHGGDANMTLHYVVQVDADRQEVDWVARAEGCRGVRQAKSSDPLAIPQDRHPYNRRLNEGVLFRGGASGARAVWVGCYQTNRTAAIVKIPLDAHGHPATAPYEPGDLGSVASKAAESPPSVGRDDVLRPRPAAGQEVFIGPKEVREYLADPVSERILAKVVDGSPVPAEVWWVFDARKQAFLGTIGIGPYQANAGPSFAGLATTSGLDPASGRFYVLAPSIDEQRAGGLFVADVRRTPVPQAVVFPEFAGILPSSSYNNVPIQVDYRDGNPETPRRLLVRAGDSYSPDSRDTLAEHRSKPFWPAPQHLILEDRLPITVDPDTDLFSGRTRDLDEVKGVTQASFDGAARGFAARAVLVGGLTAAARVGPVDPTTYDSVGREEVGSGFHGTNTNVTECRRTNRQVVVGFVGPREAAVVDGNGSRGGAEPVVVDSATRSDMQLPVSRCGVYSQPRQIPADVRVSTEWNELWSQVLFSRPPVDEPTVPWQFGDEHTECVSSDAEPSDSFGDPVTGMFASRVECDKEEMNGFGHARGVGVGELHVSEAVSKFRIYRDPGRGVVSRVESIARGVSIDGLVRIDTIRGVAESWANGRTQPVAREDQAQDYDPNCDFTRTAGTCFSRHIFGVHTPAYSCGPCGDEQALVDGLSKALGGNARVRLRDPDPILREGAPNGYIAAIQKPAHERFGDLVLHDDLLATMVPVLEIVRYAPTGPSFNAFAPSGRGLQMYQFAGVEVSSSYGIECLLVYDPDSRTCAAGPEKLGSITVKLNDPGGMALAGGSFEVRTDTDLDGVVGLVDELVGQGTCVTAEDGVGTCTFDNLHPGTYLVSQIAAPPGYSPTTQPWASEVSPGEARTVTFTNASNNSTIEVSAKGGDGAPLEGAQFAVFADPDGDGKVASDAAPTAQCTTDARGTCSMQVQTGSYVLVQMTTASGLEPIEPVALVFTAGGQVAEVSVVNYAPLRPDAPAPAPAPAPVDYSDTPAFTPSENVVAYESPGMVDRPTASRPGQVGGTVVRLIRAPGDALRLLAREPKQAVAWVGSILLFALALVAVLRRALLGELTVAPATALGFPGGGSTSSPPGPRKSHERTGPGHGGPGHPGGSRGAGREGRSHGTVRRPATSPVKTSTSAAGGHTATAVLDRPIVAGAAPTITEGPVVRVVAVTASDALAVVVSERLAKSETCELIATVASMEQLHQLTSSVRPDVLIIDLSLIVEDDTLWASVPQLHAPEHMVGLIPPDRSAEEFVARGHALGLGGMLVAFDDIGNGHLAYAVRCVAAGKRCYGPTVQTLLLDEWGGGAPGRGRNRRLSERELEVARFAAGGMRRTQIAERLYLSPWTVKRHLAEIRMKLGVQNSWDVTELRDRLHQLGLLNEPDEPGEAAD